MYQRRRQVTQTDVKMMRQADQAERLLFCSFFLFRLSQTLLNEIFLQPQIPNHVIKLLQAGIMIIFMCLRLVNEQRRIVLAREPNPVTNLEFVWNNDDLPAQKTVLNMLARHQVGACRILDPASSIKL